MRIQFFGRKLRELFRREKRKNSTMFSSTSSNQSSPPGDSSGSTASTSQFDNSGAASASASNEIFVSGLPLPISMDLNLDVFFTSEFSSHDRPSGPPITNFTEFEQACCNGDVEAVRNALISPTKSPIIDVNGRNLVTGNPILIEVCRIKCDPSHQLCDIIQLLEKHGANLNITNESGETALTMAIINSEVCKVTKLLSLGAAINLPNQFGQTPLILACEKNVENVVYRLLEHGADFNALSVDGKTALDIARQNTAEGKGKACESKLLAKIDSLGKQFNGELRKVLPPEEIHIYGSLFPMHCFSLNESSAFRVVFTMNETPPDPTPMKAYILTIAKARFWSAQHVEMKFWGVSPVKSVMLNGVEQVPAVQDFGFVFNMWPIKQGVNELIINCNPDGKQSLHKLLIDAFAVRALRTKFFEDGKR